MVDVALRPADIVPVVSKLTVSKMTSIHNYDNFRDEYACGQIKETALLTNW